MLLGTVTWLGMTKGSIFFSSDRDPVPLTQKVAHSSHCSGCHGYDETGQALRDSEGNDVNIHDDWQISMMALAAYDPFWRATLAHEVDQYPSAQSAIETTCLRCHAPLGSIQAGLDNRPYSYELMLTDSLGLDGVSCSACHQQPVQGLGKGHSGHFTIDTNRILWGQYPNPFRGPMQIYVDFEPEFSDHIYSSGICAGCHTLITETLQPDGTPSGNYFVEQATYHEWLNSSFPAQGKECQTCHLPFIEDGVIIATDLLALEERHPYGLHQFFGANTAMLEMMKANRKNLSLPDYFPGDQAWDETIQNNRISLSNAATLQTTPPYIANDTLYVTVVVKNKTGHKLPSGYPSRLSWLEVTLLDQTNGDTLYSNGSLDASGHISGRNSPYEPHHEIARSDDDVQIYELVMSDLQGQLTTRLNAAYRPLKDNRLLPTGFRTDHTTYDTVAIWGSAVTDPDYSLNSQKGEDRVEYRIALNGAKGIGQLHIALHYQSLPSRWMNDLFAHADVPEVGQFKNMYQGYEVHHETIGTTSVADIDFSTSASHDPTGDWDITLSPNPVHTRLLYLRLPETLSGKLQYDIVDSRGRVIQTGDVQEAIVLSDQVANGLYFFRIRQQAKTVGVKSIIVL